LKVSVIHDAQVVTSRGSEPDKVQRGEIDSRIGWQQGVRGEVFQFLTRCRHYDGGQARMRVSASHKVRAQLRELVRTALGQAASIVETSFFSVEARPCSR